MLACTPYDAMVLDMRMPGLDGVEVMRRVRQMWPDLSIVVLTGHATLENAISAVQSHVANYLIKPASIHEVAAALADALQQRAVRLRRQHLLQVMGQALDEVAEIEATGGVIPVPALERFLHVGSVTLDQEKRLAVVVGPGSGGGSEVELTVSQTVLLAYLMRHSGTALSCRELARAALGYDVEEPEARAVIRPHICRLRKKIEPDPTHPRLIRTVPGKGYFFAP